MGTNCQVSLVKDHPSIENISQNYRTENILDTH